MSEERSSSGALRPSGKRQITGSSTVSKYRARSAQSGPETVGGRGNIFTQIVDYFRGVVAEMRKVIWPTWRQMGVDTGVVLLFLVVVIGIVSGVDFLAGKGVEWTLTH